MVFGIYYNSYLIPWRNSNLDIFIPGINFLPLDFLTHYYHYLFYACVSGTHFYKHHVSQQIGRVKLGNVAVEEWSTQKNNNDDNTECWEAGPKARGRTADGHTPWSLCSKLFFALSWFPAPGGGHPTTCSAYKSAWSIALFTEVWESQVETSSRR